MRDQKGAFLQKFLKGLVGEEPELWKKQYTFARPDYRLVSCGTAVNRKYTSDMLRDPGKYVVLTAAIKAYFTLGGQEVQINCVDRSTRIDTMKNPENYESLVVRVSGFSAYFTKLGRDVQNDNLSRTEHSNV